MKYIVVVANVTRQRFRVEAESEEEAKTKAAEGGEGVESLGHHDTTSTLAKVDTGMPAQGMFPRGVRSR